MRHRLAAHRFALAGVNRLREQVYRQLAGGHARALLGLRQGDVLARVGTDVDAIGDAVIRGVLPFAVAALVAVVSVGIVGWVLPAAGALLAGALLVSGLAVPAMAARANQGAQSRGVAAQAEVSGIVLTLIEDAADLQVSDAAAPLHRALAAEERALASSQQAAASLAGLAAALNTFTIGACVVAIAAVGWHAFGAGLLTAPQLAMVLLTPLAAFEATALLPAALTQLYRSEAAAGRITAMLDDAGDGAAALPTPPMPPGAATHLVAHRLAVGWPGRPISVGAFDVELRPGRLVALVGSSGCGKTTVLLTLAGALPPQAGAVTLDGSPLPDQGDPRQVSLTLEDAHLFDTSVFENLRAARGDLTETEAERALDLAGLGAWRRRLSGGIHTPVASRGAALSGGERRRLLLARALVSLAPLLLLDEPTEHLDAHRADELLRQLSQTTRSGRGVLLVTHRVSGLTVADEVVVLEAGHDGAPTRVLARGTHAQLLGSCDWYRAAWQAEQPPRPPPHLIASAGTQLSSPY